MIVRIAGVGGGLATDELPHELPDGMNPEGGPLVWNDGRNVRFKDGFAQRFSGHVPALTTPVAAAYSVASYPNQGTNYWLHSTLSGVYADDGTTQTDITGPALTATADNRITSCVLGGVYVQNTQTDEPQYWGGDVLTDMQVLLGWNAAWRCRSLRAFKFYLLALNVTKSGTNFGSMVKWSHAAEPGTLPSTWDEADPTIDEGEFDLAETSDSVIDGLALGDTFVVYKDRSTYGIQYIGGNDIFRQFRMPGDHGMLTQNCGADTPAGHVVLTASDLIVHNGAGPQSIIDARMRRWLFTNLDSGNFRRSFVTANHAQSEVWVCFPSVGAGACNLALVWNYRQNRFGVRELHNVTAASAGPLSAAQSNTWEGDSDTWADDATVWDQLDVSQADKRLVMASTAPALYLMYQSGRFGGTAYEARLERTGMAFGDPSSVKVVKGIYPRIDAPVGTQIQLQVGGAMDAERGPSWSPPVTYTVGTSYRADTFASGRFLSLRVFGSGSGSWRIKSIDLDIIKRGRY